MGTSYQTKWYYIGMATLKQWLTTLVITYLTFTQPLVAKEPLYTFVSADLIKPGSETIPEELIAKDDNQPELPTQSAIKTSSSSTKKKRRQLTTL